MEINITPEIREDLKLIKNSGLFDEAWYLRTYSDVARLNLDPVIHYVIWGANESRNPALSFSTTAYLKNVDPKIIGNRNPFAHFIRHGNPLQLIDRGLFSKLPASLINEGMKNLLRLPVFSEEEYAGLNDIGSLTPSNHAFVLGCLEGRDIFDKVKVAKVLSMITSKSLAKEDRKPLKPSPKIKTKFALLYNEHVSEKNKQVASLLGASLKGSGQEAELIETRKSRGLNDATKIIVAPHEFFFDGDRMEHIASDLIGNAIMLNTEASLSAKFSKALPFMLMSRGVINIADHVDQLFKEAGIKSVFYDPIMPVRHSCLRPNPEMHPMVSALPASAHENASRTTPFVKRPIDVAFLGRSSAYRNRFFSRNAQFFAPFECFFYYKGEPRRNAFTIERDASTEFNAFVAMQTKVWLNIGNAEEEILGWHRIQQGFIAGAVVVTEPMFPHPVFRLGVHYLEEKKRHLSNLIEWLLEARDGRLKAQEIQENVSLLLKDRRGTLNDLRMFNFLNPNNKAFQ